MYSDFIYGHVVKKPCFSTVRKKKNTTRAIIFTKSYCTKKKKTVVFLFFLTIYIHTNREFYKIQIQFFVYTSDFHFLPLTILRIPSLSSSAALFFITYQPTDFKRIYYPEPRMARQGWRCLWWRMGREKKETRSFGYPTTSTRNLISSYIS